MKARHIEDGVSGITLCGHPVSLYPCIDKRRDAIDDATCGNCHRVDDARSLATYWRECLAAGVEP